MTPALACDGLCAGRDGRTIVRDLSFHVDGGEIVALLGANGSGKSTTLLTIAGLLPAIDGSVMFYGQRVTARRPHRVTRQGLLLVPDDRALFSQLTVRQHLSLAQRKDGMHPDDILDRFPSLRRRLNVAAGLLSGGEQQMLAIGRALIQRPKVLMVDELSLGLAPVVVDELLPAVAAAAREDQMAVILVEQHVSLVLGVADRAILLSHGRAVLEESAERLRDEPALIEQAYFGTHEVDAES